MVREERTTRLLLADNIRRLALVLLGEALGDAEVDQLQAPLNHHEIRGFQVGVHDVLGVDRPDSLHHLLEPQPEEVVVVLLRLRRALLVALRQQVRQVRLSVLQDVVDQTLVADNLGVEQVDYVRPPAQALEEGDLVEERLEVLRLGAVHAHALQGVDLPIRRQDLREDVPSVCGWMGVTCEETLGCLSAR